MLSSRYLDRLGFSDERERLELQTTWSKQNLDRLMEAHLEHITFDNLSQHGLPYPATLDVNANAQKLLTEKRGGFCFELNGLFGELLIELGYHVKRVPAFVYAGDIGFRHMATHLILVVSLPSSASDRNDGTDKEEWCVDVGFGEPAIHSLIYKTDIVQETPEGMTSRLVMCQEDPQSVILEWKKDSDDEWSPRLKWEFLHPGQPLQDFQEGLDAVLGETSIFHQKLIVCRITKEEKLSLAGNRLKRTAPRFGPNTEVSVERLDSLEEVKRILQDVFHVPNTDGLDLTKSINAAPEVWTQL